MGRETHRGCRNLWEASQRPKSTCGDHGEAVVAVPWAGFYLENRFSTAGAFIKPLLVLAALVLYDNWRPRRRASLSDPPPSRQYIANLVMKRPASQDYRAWRQVRIAHGITSEVKFAYV